MTQPQLGEPDPRLIGRGRLVGDPMPMPRARARIAGKFPKQWVQFYEPKAAMTRQDHFRRLWGMTGAECVPEGVPLLLVLRFVFLRPAYHFGTGRNAQTLKPQHIGRRPGKGGGTSKDPQGGEHPTGGDLDNLIKLVKDGLTGAAYADDGQVARVEAEKYYVDQIGEEKAQTQVELREMA